MPAKALIAPRVDPDAMKQEGLTVIQPLALVVDHLQVRTPAEYQVADAVLHRITTARKTWGERIEKIIRPIRLGLDELYGLNREVDRPLEALAEMVKGRMKAFKVEELRVLRLAEEVKEREAARLRKEAADKELAAASARTAQMRGKLQAASNRASEQAVAVEQQETPAPTYAESSTTRPVKKLRVANMAAFVKGIVDGYVPIECVTVVDKVMNQYLKADPEGMAAWPGVEVYDDVQIVGR